VGTWGAEIFDDDVALDVQGCFEDGIEAAASPQQAADRVLASMRDSLEDTDDEPVLSLALASLLLDEGVVQHPVLDRAREILETGAGLERWEEAGPEALAERQAVYGRLAERLPSEAQSKAPPASPLAAAASVTRRMRRAAKSELPYKEGDWFAVPLTDGGYGLGRVARMNGQGHVLGYFFGPRRRDIPTEEDARGLTAADAVLVAQFGDLALLEGTWPILPSGEPWNREDWPMPVFGTRAAGIPRRRRYDESTFRFLGEVRAPLEEVRRLPEDLFYGSVALEVTLSRLLRPRHH
jgi:hypothetical protein